MTTTDTPTSGARRLTRSHEDRIVAGVCSGAGRYWDVDPVIPRIILAVLAVFGGAGIAIYAFAWLLMPEDGSPATRLERWLEGRRGDRGRDLLIVIVALVSVSFLVDTNPFAHRLSAAALAVVLVLVVSALVSRRRGNGIGIWSRSQTPQSAPPVFYGPPPPGQDQDQDQRTTTWEQPTVAMPVATPVVKRRERSWLGWLTVGVTMLVAGIFGAVGAAGWAHPQPADVLAACVGVLGLGLLVGTVFGRAWSLIPLGILLIGALAVANALPRNLTWTAGNRAWTPTVATSSAYVLGAGDASLDLSQLPAHESATVTSRVGTGRLVVIVPLGTTLNVHATASAGRVLVYGYERDGTGVDVRRTVPSLVKNPRTLTLNIEMGFGDVEVRHGAA